MNKGTILLADGDRDLCQAFTEMMAFYDEFQVHCVKSAQRAIETARTLRVDLLIMEVGFPDMDGREAVRILRKGGFTAPIIMLTNHRADSDIILGLEFGADVYVTKPLVFPVFLARIRAQLHHWGRSEDAIYPIGKFLFHPSGNRLVHEETGSRVLLTKKESIILKHLYRAGPQVVSRNVLLKEVWGYSPKVATHTLDTHIYRLRQKIEPDPSDPVLLVTGSGGYKLVPWHAD